MLTTESIPQPAQGVIGRRVDDEAVLVLPDRGQVKVVNPVGARIWELVDGRRSVAAIAEAICAEYQVERDQAEADVLEFLHALADKGAIRAG